MREGRQQSYQGRRISMSSCMMLLVTFTNMSVHEYKQSVPLRHTEYKLDKQTKGIESDIRVNNESLQKIEPTGRGGKVLRKRGGKTVFKVGRL